MFKKVTKAGGVTIPRSIRDELNIPKGAAVEINPTEDGVLIKKHVPTCMICGTADHVHVMDHVELCETHLKEMLEQEETQDGYNGDQAEG